MSGLINALLDKHYAGSPTPSDKPVAKLEEPEHQGVPPPEEAQPAQAQELCTHGAAPGFCKHTDCPNYKERSGAHTI